MCKFLLWFKTIVLCCYEMFMLLIYMILHNDYFQLLLFEQILYYKSFNILCSDGHETRN